MVTKIISGGQTGVDRAALDFAIERGIPHGGHCPRGRRSESGRISDKYKLVETSSPDYPMRTVLNVQNSDGTLIIAWGHPEGGTRKTLTTCNKKNKPVFVVNLQKALDTEGFCDWVRQYSIKTLNVAGPRESKQSGIGKQTKRVLSEFFAVLTLRLRSEGILFR